VFTSETVEDFAQARENVWHRGRDVERYEAQGLLVVSGAQPKVRQPARDIVVVSLFYARVVMGVLPTAIRSFHATPPRWASLGQRRLEFVGRLTLLSSKIPAKDDLCQSTSPPDHGPIRTWQAPSLPGERCFSRTRCISPQTRDLKRAKKSQLRGMPLPQHPRGKKTPCGKGIGDAQRNRTSPTGRSILNAACLGGRSCRPAVRFRAGWPYAQVRMKSCILKFLQLLRASLGEDRRLAKIVSQVERRLRG
jgi:hypothetical protein